MEGYVSLWKTHKPSEGAYLLRSNITDWSDQQLWKASSADALSPVSSEVGGATRHSKPVVAAP